MKQLLTLAAILLVMLFIGAGAFTFHYGEGFSYFSKDPKSCVNCHIMQPQFDAWQKASHHTVASCADCHLPQTFPHNYVAKAKNGYFHSKGFTFQDFPEPIMITKSNSKILEQNCLRCHSDIIHGTALNQDNKMQNVSCVHCHKSVGHGIQSGMGKIYETEEIKVNPEVTSFIKKIKDPQ